VHNKYPISLMLTSRYWVTFTHLIKICEIALRLFLLWCPKEDLITISGFMHIASFIYLKALQIKL